MQILKRKPDEPSNKLPKQVLNLQDQMDFTSSNLGSPIGAKNLEPQEEHAPPLELRARFKKQMLDKELSGCLKQQRLLVRLDELKEERSRLIEEENELAAERERCMKIDLDSNSFDPESPYYMDDRLNLISSEMNMLDSRIAELEKDVEKPAPIEDSSVFTDSPGGSWENAENILNSLDNPEIQLVSKMFMKEAIDLKASGIEKDAKIVEKDKVILELRAAMENLRCAALKTAMQFEKKIQDIQENAKKVLETNIVSVETPLRIVPASVLSPNRNSLTPKPNWTEYSQDPSIAATAIVNNALSKIPRPEDSSEISPDGRSLTPLIPIPRVNNSKNYTISDVSTPNRHKSAPLDSSDKKPPILVSSYPIVTDLKKPSFPRRSPSPGKTTGINSKLEPLVRSFSVKPVSAIVDEGAVSVSDDDIQVWKDALIQLQKTEVDNENVYDRLHSKHTKSSRLKKI